MAAIPEENETARASPSSVSARIALVVNPRLRSAISPSGRPALRVALPEVVDEERELRHDLVRHLSQNAGVAGPVLVSAEVERRGGRPPDRAGEPHAAAASPPHPSRPPPRQRDHRDA